MKVLAIGDLHIHDYPNYNIKEEYPSYRLNQFSRLADKLLEIVEQNHAEELWIAGDLLFTPNCRPIVLTVLHNFLHKISSVLTVRIIMGNHDIDTKHKIHESTSLGWYSPLFAITSSMKNVHLYIDDLVTISGRTVHFLSWSPTKEYQYKEADILVAHDDVAGAWYNKISLISGIDTKSYKKAIVGHIHNHQIIGNTIIPGSPIMHNHGDSQNCGVIIFDLDTLDYEFVSTGNNFLKFVTVNSTDEIDSSIDEDNLAIRVSSSPLIDDISSEAINTSFSPIEIAKSYIPSDFSDIERGILLPILESSTASDSVLPSLSFKINRVTIENFLSIHNLDLNLSDISGFNIIQGENGSGKSTLYKFIRYMLFGKLPGYLANEIISLGKEHMHGEVELTYLDTNYKIIRDRGANGNGVQFFINDVIVPANTVSITEDTISSSLKFKELEDFLFITQSSEGIFAGMSDSSRVSFMSKFIGLPLIESWSSQLTLKIDNLESEKTKLVNNLNEILGVVRYLQTQIDSDKELTPIDESRISCEIEDVKKEMEKKKAVINSIYENLHKSKSAIDNHERLSNIYNSKSRSYINLQSSNDFIPKLDVTRSIEAMLNDLDQVLAEIIKDEAGLIENQRELESSISSFVTKLDSLKNDLNNHIMEEKSLITECNTIQNSIDKMSKETLCPVCEQKLSVDKAEELLSLYKTKLEDFISKKSKVEAVISSFKLAIDTIEVERNSKIQELENIKLKSNSLFNRKHVIKEASLLLKDLDFSLPEVDRNKLILEIEKYENELLSANTSQTELVNLLSTLEKNMAEAIYVNKKIEERKQKIKELDEKTVEVDTLRNKIDHEFDLPIKRLTQYNKKVLSSKGLVVASLLKLVADKLNNDKRLLVTTIEELGNGSLKPTLQINLYVDEYKAYVPYDHLSGGQRLFADILFLSKLTFLIDKLGDIYLDELFKFFDKAHMLEAYEILKDSNIERVFLIIHDDILTSVSDNVVSVELTEDGSKYSILSH